VLTWPCLTQCASGHDLVTIVRVVVQHFDLFVRLFQQQEQVEIEQGENEEWHNFEDDKRQAEIPALKVFVLFDD